MSTKLDKIEKLSKYITIFIISLSLISLFSYALFSGGLNFINFRDKYIVLILWTSILPPFYFIFNDLPTPTSPKKSKITDFINKLSYRRLYYFIKISNYLGMSFIMMTFLFTLYYSESVNASLLGLLEFIGLILYLIPIGFVSYYKKSAMYLSMYLKTKKRNHLIKCFNLINDIYSNNLEYDVLKNTVHIIDTYELFGQKSYEKYLHELLNGLETMNRVKIGNELCNILKIEAPNLKLSEITIKKELSISKQIFKLFTNIKMLIVPLVLYIFTSYVFPYVLYVLNLNQ